MGFCVGWRGIVGAATGPLLPAYSLHFWVQAPLLLLCAQRSPRFSSLDAASARLGAFAELLACTLIGDAFQQEICDAVSEQHVAWTREVHEVLCA